MKKSERVLSYGFSLAPRRFLVLGALLLFTLTGCRTLIEKPTDVSFHDCYEAIIDPAAHQFVQEALRLLDEKYGGPRSPVDTVHLRTSRKNETGRLYCVAERFSKTEIVEPGEVAIYIAVPPGHKEFYPMLGHECGHLFDPSVIDDWEMEGFCMVFSEELCEQAGYSWEVWRRRYSRESSDPYARAYWNVKEEPSGND